ncbi:MAG: hypothetical protein HKN10_15080 [Myxococcales bacterium]|nr:hypothetical protein [Myxococcales bacterium]
MLRTTMVLTFVLASACVSSQQVSDAPADPETWEESKRPEVSNMHLSQTWGEVGRPFRSNLKLNTNLEKDREYSIANLPPGLRFDEKTGTIVGVPKKRGFYVVNVAVRRKIDDRPLRYVHPSGHDRWFSEEFELRIYNHLH